MNSTISDGLVIGSDFSVIRVIKDLPTGQVLSKAWFTVKVSPDYDDSQAVFQISVTAVANNDGQITNTGASGTGLVSFNLSAANTALLKARKRYWYGIKVKMSDGKVYEPQIDTFHAHAPITRSTV